VDSERIDILIQRVTAGISRRREGTVAITVSATAEDVSRKRETKVPELDSPNDGDDYWEERERGISTRLRSLISGLREAMRIVMEEGLEARWKGKSRESVADRGRRSDGIGLLVKNPEDGANGDGG